MLVGPLEKSVWWQSVCWRVLGKAGVLCFGGSDSDSSKLEGYRGCVTSVESYPATGKVERV